MTTFLVAGFLLAASATTSVAASEGGDSFRYEYESQAVDAGTWHLAPVLVGDQADAFRFSVSGQFDVAPWSDRSYVLTDGSFSVEGAAGEVSCVREAGENTGNGTYLGEELGCGSGAPKIYRVNQDHPISQVTDPLDICLLDLYSSVTGSDLVDTFYVSPIPIACPAGV